MDVARLNQIKRRIDQLDATTELGELFKHSSGQYFKYDENEQIFLPAYSVKGLLTLGDYESGAMEKPVAEFVLNAREDLLWLIEQLESRSKS